MKKTNFNYQNLEIRFEYNYIHVKCNSNYMYAKFDLYFNTAVKQYWININYELDFDNLHKERHLFTEDLREHKLDYNFLSGCYIILKDWKNESFPYRENNKDLWANFFTLIYSREVNFNFDTHFLGKLSNLSDNDKFFEYNMLSEKYVYPRFYINSLRYHSIDDFFLKVKKIFFDRDQAIHYSFYQHKCNPKYMTQEFKDSCDWYLGIDDKINDGELIHFDSNLNKIVKNEQFMIIKPNGYNWIKTIFDLINRPVKVTDIIILQTKEYTDFIKFFYPYCHSRPYGLEWYSYLQERPLIFVRFLCDISTEEFNWVKNKARSLSKFIWTKNIMHCYENEAEKTLMRLFYDKITNCRQLLDNEWMNQINLIETNFKKNNTVSYKILGIF